MKKITIITLAVLFSNILFSQNIVESYPKITNKTSSFGLQIVGYNTHFKSAGITKIFLAHEQDTIQVSVQNMQEENFIYAYISAPFPSKGYYDMILQNDSDGIMYRQNAILVGENAFLFAMDPIRCVSDTLITVEVFGSQTHFLSGGQMNAFLVNYNKDTILVDSIFPSSENVLNARFYIPNDAVGYYSFHAFNPLDSSLMIENMLRVMNPSQTQINHVSPDSINNLTYQWEIFIYGNQTHFMADTNLLFLDYSSYGGEISNVTALDDTVLKFTINLPMPIKSVVFPNNIFYLYNPTDGLFKYPFRIDLYGSIGDQNSAFSQIKVYPNPSKDWVTISSDELTNAGLISVFVYSPSGAKIREIEFKNQSEISLNISDFDPGIYLFYIQTKDKSQLLKVIKK